MIQTTRPNILLITCDQLRSDYIGANGNPFIRTPNIDRLAREGCNYRQAYSPNPVCVAARHNLLTGLTARYHGFDDNYFGRNAKPVPYYLPVFPQILSDHGYETAAIGKMHFQPRRRANGFDFLYSMEEIPFTRESDDYAMYLKEKGYGRVQSIHGVRGCLYMQPQRSLIPETLHGSAWVADRTIQYLEETRGRKPFLLWASFIEPHPPFDVPERWADLYRGKIPPPKRGKTPLSRIGEENKKLACLETPEEINRMRELYASAISFADYQIGRILEAIERLGLFKNTMVVFTSDHGEMLGDLGTFQKFLPYDASCKIPMVIRFPGVIEAGSQEYGFADLNDLLPTFLDAARISYPGKYNLPGESLLRISSGNKDRSIQYTEHQRQNKRWCCMRNKRYKYIHYYGDEDQFFDLDRDEDETENILLRPLTQSELEMRDILRSHLINYEKRFGLEGYIVNGDFKEFEPYEPRPEYETNIPRFREMIVDEGEARELQDYMQEVLQAIAEEPVVDLRRNHTAEILRQTGKYQEEEIDKLLEAASRQRKATKEKRRE